MTAYVALLRGINVGGRQKVAMSGLRALLESLGHEGVRTYLQSGDSVFTSPRGKPEQLAREIEEAIARDLTLDVRVLVRTCDELAATVAANPFPEAVAEPSRLLVVFLSADPPADRLAALDSARFAPDEFRVGDRVIYARYPEGMGRSKLAGELTDRRLGVVATARNWSTVTKLLELASES